MFCWNLLSTRNCYFLSLQEKDRQTELCLQLHRKEWWQPPLDLHLARKIIVVHQVTCSSKNPETPLVWSCLWSEFKNAISFLDLFDIRLSEFKKILFDIIISGNFFKLLSLMISLLLLLIHFIFFHRQDPRKGKLIQASLNTRKIHCFWGLWRWSSQGNEKKELQYRFCSDTFCCKQSIGTNSTKCYSLSCALAENYEKTLY